MLVLQGDELPDPQLSVLSSPHSAVDLEKLCYLSHKTCVTTVSLAAALHTFTLLILSLRA